MAGGLGLGELVDLEAALRAGHGAEALAPESAAEHRDGGRKGRVRLLCAWLDAVYGNEPRPGERFAGALTLLTGGLVALGVLLGTGAAQYALSYDGTHPVNVVTFLSLLILPQIGLLALIALNLAVRSVAVRRATERSLGLAHEALLAVVRSRSGEAKPAAHAGVDLQALYRPAEAWRVFWGMQLFGVAFNVAAAVTALGLVSFTDLAFSWSTTLQVDAAEAHRYASALGKPFPRLVPSLEVVEATRYYRLEGRYAGGVATRAVDLAATAAWWPYLAACLLAYGLLPRLVLALLGYVLYRRRLTRAPLEEAYEVDRLLRGLAARGSGGQRSGSQEVAALRPAKDASPRSPGVAIIWRDAPWSEEAACDFVAACTGAPPVAVVRSGADFEGRETAGRLPAAGPIYILVDSFETLQKALIRFVRGLRESVARQRQIVLLPTEERSGRLAPPAGAAQRAYWRGAAQSLGDAFLGADVGEDLA
jgi:hypothetical protein